jgi:hypothetical protein
VPEHPPPLHPANAEPAAGVANSTTLLPAPKEYEHVPGQEIPPGELVTVPDPEPAVVTVSVCSTGDAGWNVAVTDWSVFIVTVQVPAPEQPPPDQPANAEPESGAAVSVTCVPSLNTLEQVLPQSIPDGELVTAPEPEPFLVTVRVCCTGANVAVTD